MGIIDDPRQGNLDFSGNFTGSVRLNMPSIDPVFIDVEAFDEVAFLSKISGYISKDRAGRINNMDHIFLSVGGDEPRPLSDYMYDLTIAEGAKQFLVDVQRRQVLEPFMMIARPSASRKIDQGKLIEICDEVEIIGDIGKKIVQPCLVRLAGTQNDVGLTKEPHCVFVPQLEIEGLQERYVRVKAPYSSVGVRCLSVKTEPTVPTATL